MSIRKTTLFSWLILVALYGCGGGPKVPEGLVPVSGKVTQKGSPLAEGTVTFSTGDGKQVYTGKIVTGAYKLALSPSAPGAKPGDYKVSVQSWSTHPSMDANGKPVEGKRAVAEKYFDPKTSELTAKVPDKGGTFDFDLKDAP